MLALRLWAAGLARRAGLYALGVAFCLLGAIFLLMAIWIGLAAALGPLLAALTLALICIGTGFLFMVLARRILPVAAPHAARVAATAPPPSPIATAALMELPVIQAFLIGLRAGSRRARR